MDRIKEIVRNKLKEMSATNQGGASFTPGEGANYATPTVFNKNKNAKGAKNIYYYKLGFKNVPNIKPKSYDKKKLWEMNDFQKQRIAGLDEIEKLMNEITPLVSNAKNDTIELYGGNAGSYDITQPIEIVKNYLKEIKELLTEK
jgi:hypothetical protein|tara:strand:+ start:631 stop:1062 length:432 start_codon:yes stop_codon:yes gene_type:complete